MTWSYESSDPTLNDLNRVRFNIADTDSAAPLLQDEEISFLLEDHSVLDASVLAASHIARRFARKADKSVGDLKIEYSKRAEAYEKIALSIAAGTPGRAVAAPAVMDDSIPKAFSVGEGPTDSEYVRATRGVY